MCVVVDGALELCHDVCAARTALRRGIWISGIRFAGTILNTCRNLCDMHRGGFFWRDGAVGEFVLFAPNTFVCLTTESRQQSVATIPFESGAQLLDGTEEKKKGLRGEELWS